MVLFSTKKVSAVITSWKTQWIWYCLEPFLLRVYLLIAYKFIRLNDLFNELLFSFNYFYGTSYTIFISCYLFFLYICDYYFAWMLKIETLRKECSQLKMLPIWWSCIQILTPKTFHEIYLLSMSEFSRGRLVNLCGHEPIRVINLMFQMSRDKNDKNIIPLSSPLREPEEGEDPCRLQSNFIHHQRTEIISRQMKQTTHIHTLAERRLIILGDTDYSVTAPLCFIWPYAITSKKTFVFKVT